MIHILNPTTTTTSDSPQTFQCTLCDPERTFLNEEALFQHNRSRHSQPTASHCRVEDPPSLTRSESDPNLPSSECPICGILLKTSLDDHLQEIIPPDPLSLRCLSCQKIFHTERSLQQHLNFCQTSQSLDLKSESREESNNEPLIN